jgi:uncharacterized membrane protein
MRARLQHLWDTVRSSLWFLPLVMTAGATALALALLRMDRSLGEEWASTIGWVYSRSDAASQTVLAAIASSMVTITGLAFSIIVVALQLASSQFGPRLLRNFMRDLGNQVVLGTFIATFVYCLLVMRTLGSDLVADGAPRLSVSVAVMLAVASLGVLIYFLHHAAASMQAPNVIAQVSGELQTSIGHLFPEELGEGGGPDEPPVRPPVGAVEIPVSKSGYVQRVHEDGLLGTARAYDVTVRLYPRPGQFVIEGEILAAVWPADRATDEVTAGIRASCLIGQVRTAEQDVEFVIDQLVEIAVRALSPGINDPLTAIGCLDHLAAAFSRLATRRMPSANRYDPDGRLRLVADRPSHAGLLDAALNKIRQSSRTQPAVIIRTLEMLEILAGRARTPAARAAVARHAALLEANREALPDAADRQAIQERHSRVRAALAA